MKRYKPLLIFFVLDFLSYAIDIFVYTIEQFADKTSIAVFRTFLRYLYILNVGPVTIGFAIVYLKDNLDVIQEISKLDILCKVSIFQN
jgi:hypothetical protein